MTTAVSPPGAGRKTVVLLGSLASDRGPFDYVRNLINARGHEVVLIDSALPTLLDQLQAAAPFDGALGLGDAAAQAVTTVMRQLPLGMPRLMVTTHSSGDTRPYVDINDIIMMNSIVDVERLNRVTRRIVTNAAGAICGMIEQQVEEVTGRPLIAATMFGVTTPCVTAVREGLERAGFEVLIFHATGSGGRAMERLIEDDYFAGVVDLTTTEWADEVGGGLRSAGPDRLGAAGRRGIPQLVSVGALDMVNFGTLETVPIGLRQRKLHRHSPAVTLMRTSAQENAEIGRRMAEKLNQARGPTVLMLPLRGVSMIDAEGQPFHDPAANQALFDSLRAHRGPRVRLIEVDAHINDPAFSDAVVTNFLAIMNEH